MNSVLLIEKETPTVNSLTWFFSALQAETIVVHRWPSPLKSLQTQKFSVVFFNAEMSTVNIDEVFESFPQDNPDSTPVFYFYTRTYAPRVRYAENFPYKARFKKPLQLEEIYSRLSDFFQLDGMPQRSKDYRAKLYEFKHFSKEFKAWLDGLNRLIAPE